MYVRAKCVYPYAIIWSLYIRNPSTWLTLLSYIFMCVYIERLISRTNTKYRTKANSKEKRRRKKETTTTKIQTTKKHCCIHTLVCTVCMLTEGEKDGERKRVEKTVFMHDIVERTNKWVNVNGTGGRTGGQATRNMCVYKHKAYMNDSRICVWKYTCRCIYSFWYSSGARSTYVLLLLLWLSLLLLFFLFVSLFLLLLLFAFFSYFFFSLSECVRVCVCVE